MLPKEKVRERAHVPGAGLWYSLWTRLSASCICSFLVFQCYVSSFQELPEWERGFVWLHTGWDATTGFSTFPSLRKARLMISCCQWNTRTQMGYGGQGRNIHQGVVKTFISLAGSTDPENHILKHYFSYINWLIQTIFNQFVWWWWTTVAVGHCAHHLLLLAGCLLSATQK